MFIYASREDHIVPMGRGLQVHPGADRRGAVRFVMGASGHIAGVINPPAKGKRSHWIGTGARCPPMQAGLVRQGHRAPWQLVDRLGRLAKPHAGKADRRAKAYGNRSHKAIEPAPGRYVKQKA